MRIEWDFIEGHERAFRKSPEFRSLLAKVKSFFEQIREMKQARLSLAAKAELTWREHSRIETLPHDLGELVWVVQVSAADAAESEQRAGEQRHRHHCSCRSTSSRSSWPDRPSKERSYPSLNLPARPKRALPDALRRPLRS